MSLYRSKIRGKCTALIEGDLYCIRVNDTLFIPSLAICEVQCPKQMTLAW